MKTLQSIVEHRMWCCSLDVAVLAVLGCALARLHPNVPLRLRFVASARDQGDEGDGSRDGLRDGLGHCISKQMMVFNIFLLPHLILLGILCVATA